MPYPEQQVILLPGMCQQKSEGSSAIVSLLVPNWLKPLTIALQAYPFDDPKYYVAAGRLRILIWVWLWP